MGKVPQLLCLVALTIVGFGTWVVPDDPLFVLASGDLAHQIIRLLLAALVIVQLTTNPPRHIAVRAITGMSSVGIAIWFVAQFFTYSVQLMDVMVFTGVGLVLYATALERTQTLPEVITQPFRVRVHRVSSHKVTA